MSFHSTSHQNFDEAFSTLVQAWVRADDLRAADAPIGQRARATFDLSVAREQARVAREHLCC